MPRQREQHGQKPSIKRTWRHEVLKKAHCGWDGALELGSRGFSRMLYPGQLTVFRKATFI